MLQGSVDGDPAAPAGFAEALSERAQKSTPRGAFFMSGIWGELKYQQHHKPTVRGGLAPDSGVSATDRLTDTPPSGASPLPHFELHKAWNYGWFWPRIRRPSLSTGI